MVMYIRLPLLLMTAGTFIFRKILLKYTNLSKSENLNTFLKPFKNDLKKIPEIKNRFKELFPEDGTGIDIENLDLTLLATVLIHCGSLETEMVVGIFKIIPQSTIDDIKKIRNLQNQLSHPSMMPISRSYFEYKWKDLKRTFKYLVNREIPEEISELSLICYQCKTQPLKLDDNVVKKIYQEELDQQSKAVKEFEKELQTLTSSQEPSKAEEEDTKEVEKELQILTSSQEPSITKEEDTKGFLTLSQESSRTEEEDTKVVYMRINVLAPTEELQERVERRINGLFKNNDKAVSFVLNTIDIVDVHSYYVAAKNESLEQLQSILQLVKSDELKDLLSNLASEYGGKDVVAYACIPWFELEKMKHDLQEANKKNKNNEYKKYEARMKFVSEAEGNPKQSVPAYQIEDLSWFIDTICERNGRTSDILKIKCENICAQITDLSKEKKIIRGLKCIWPAYQLQNETHVIFVMVCEKQDDIEKHKLCAPFDTLDTIIRDSKEFSDEDSEVMMRSTGMSLIKDEHMTISSVLKQKSNELLQNHSNLSIISACPLKSKGFGAQNPEILKEACIVLFVRIKGLIPISEEAFPKSVEGLTTDVREGVFEFYTSKIYHSKLKIGCQITGDEIFQSKIEIGTIGPFVNDDQNNMCCITSAHVVLSRNSYGQLQDKGTQQFQTDEKKVYQPSCQNDTYQFGHILRGVFKTGEPDKIGVEAALVKITDTNRIPSSVEFPEGNFPNDGSLTNVKFSGKIGSTQFESTVYKYGSWTGWTTGRLNSDYAVVRPESQTHTRLHNQIQIRDVKPTERFADYGDSGSLVFIAHDDDISDLRALGILTGGSKSVGIVFVTPIVDVLKELNCTLADFMENTDS